jgi:hypothetical protein
LIVTGKSWTHWTPDARDASQAWEVAPGGRYFYCWTIGDPLTRHNDVSDKWVETADDHGNKDVYLSVIWLRDADTGALPRC